MWKIIFIFVSGCCNPGGSVASLLIEMELYSDAYYIERVKAGDESCFGCLLDKYSSRVFTLVYRIVGNREDAEELTQDVFLKAFRKLDSFKGDSSFSTWIYRIAYNASISQTRKHHPDCLSLEEELVAGSEEDLSAHLEETDAQEQIDMLEAALGALPADERAFILLFYKEEKSIEEIALITGFSAGNVKVKLHRIRKKLMEIIKKMQKEQL